MSKENILSRWRSTGLWPTLPIRVLRGLPKDSPILTPQPVTPGAILTLDQLLLKSSPPELVKLSRSNKKFIELLREYPDIVSPVKRYIERIICLYETQNTTIAIIAKQLANQSELLKKRKKITKEKRIRLKGVSVYMTTDILRIAREEEAQLKTKKLKGRLRKIIKIESSTKDEDKVSKDLLDSFNELPPARRRRVVFSYIKI
jgi:hypothetical protein